MEHQKEQLVQQKERMEAQQKVHQRQLELQRKAQKEQLEAVMARLITSRDSAPAASVLKFAPFNSTTELWKNYMYRARFDTFAGANFIPDRKMAQVF